MWIRVARKTHQERGVRCVEVKSGPARTTNTREYELLGVTEWARKSHRDPEVRFVTDKSGLERATKTREYDLVQTRVGQQEPPRPRSTICYG